MERNREQFKGEDGENKIKMARYHEKTARRQDTKAKREVSEISATGISQE